MEKSEAKRGLFVFIAIAVFVLAIVSICLWPSGSQYKNYVGTWYNIDNPEYDTLILTEDQHFSWDGYGGTVSVVDGGLVLIDNSGWMYPENVLFDKYETHKALVFEDGRIYINNFSEATRYERERYEAELALRQAEEITELERIQREQASSIAKIKDIGYTGTYIGSYNYDELTLFDDGTYYFHSSKNYKGVHYDDTDGWQTGTWSVYEADKLYLALTPVENSPGLQEEFDRVDYGDAIYANMYFDFDEEDDVILFVESNYHYNRRLRPES